MAEQTFRSPGFFEREIDATQRTTEIVGTPAGVIGTAEKGPAFIPVTVGSMTDFVNKFGEVDPNRFGPYAVDAFLANRTALTYMRVLGAGANETSANITSTQNNGTVVNAGFKIVPKASQYNGWGNATPTADSAVQFLVARHYVSSSNDYSFPQFIDNPSFNISGAGRINLLRGVILFASGARGQIMDDGETWSSTLNDAASLNHTKGTAENDQFVLVVSSTLGASYTSQYKDVAGVGINLITASLDPSNPAYIANVLNTDPTKFYQQQHLLYLDFAVEDELASVDQTKNAVALLSGSTNQANNYLSDKNFATGYGRFDTRYTTPRSPTVISQPYGGQEHDLFHFETLSDGAWGNDKVKCTIANLRASTNDNYPYPQFEVQVRRFDDTDMDPQVLETYPACNLDPASENFIARKVGDYKARYNFDADNASEKRILVTGRYPNVSNFVRVVLSEKIYTQDLPKSACPFGFKGIPVIKTTDSLSDSTTFSRRLQVGSVAYGNGDNYRMWGDLPEATIPDSGGERATFLSGSIVPPLPYRFKLTRGPVSTTGHFAGDPGPQEIVDRRLNWGVKYTRCPETSSMDNASLNVNASSNPNPLIAAYAKFQGIEKLDMLVTGSGKDNFNANKFTLSRVALANVGTTATNLFQYVTASAKEHILEAAYIRNGVPDSKTYAVMDPDKAGQLRVTYASLIQSSSVKFNRFTGYTAFNVPVYGGFDGLNILDKDMAYMTDRASSTDASVPAPIGKNAGKASSEYGASNMGLIANPAGTGRLNNSIAAYKQAATVMTDPTTTRINILAIPGIRDSFVTDHAAEKTLEYSMAMYVMDIPAWSEDETRLWGDEDRAAIASASIAFPDVRETSEQFESRVFDNNYTATYFPDVYITDRILGSKVKVPASIPVMSALGYNDSVAYPWFAPAGFNRGGLDLVSNTDVRLTSGDRDTLYDSRVNPIANFADGKFVIFGQKTCQLAQSALDRVNVRRMLLEVKRQVTAVADKILFEPNTPATRARFINQVTPLLATIQSQQGIESFNVVMDDTNNTRDDVENNKLNGRIVVVPTRAIEFIAIDFIITNSGVDFA